jgi:coenzyme F420-reducing hydrogenase beta subunit
MIKLDKEQCCGCGACEQACPRNAISLVSDEEGFSYPRTNTNMCISCDICNRICPYTCLLFPLSPHYLCYAAKHKDTAALEKSSSGGMFIALSDRFLEHGGVIYGSGYDANIVARHMRAINLAERNNLCGSKYVQSEISNTYTLCKIDIQQNKEVLFVGTPCQLAGLNSFLGELYRPNLLTVSIICHGVPSPKLFAEYLEYSNRKRNAHIVEYCHRPKTNYWGHIERSKFIYVNGEINSDSDSVLSQAWKWLFYSNAALRPCCYKCPWTKNGHSSDITIGDFWGIEDVMPDFYDKLGVSAVLINTKKGELAFEKISGTIDKCKSSFEDILRKNPNLTVCSYPLTNRRKFWKLYYEKGFAALVRRYGRINMYWQLKNLARKVVRKASREMGQ